MASWSPWDWIAYVALALMTVIRALDEATVRSETLQGLKRLIPDSRFWGYVPLALLIAASAIFFYRESGLDLPPAVLGVVIALIVALFLAFIMIDRVRPQARAPYLEILAPLDGSQIGFTREVSGAVNPPGGSVQVLVFSGDGRWHPQSSASVDGRAWNASCTFGAADSARRSFRIVAISADTRIDKPIDALPKRCVRSQVVTVTRTS